MFQPGAKVKWSSQAMGCTTEKRGHVLAFIPAGTNVIDAYPEAAQLPEKQVRAQLSFGPRDRYLVEVMIGIKVRRPVYYLPYAKGVEADTSGTSQDA